MFASSATQATLPTSKELIAPKTPRTAPTRQTRSYLPSEKPILMRRSWYTAGKIVFDFCITLVLSILALPPLLLIALLVKLTSRGPVLYSQVRLGRHGKPFSIYKIRTMVHECERASGARWSQPGDPRVTPLGRILRASHLDELPQLWNILRGDMSLVGPRPERPEFVPVLEQAIANYRARLQVRPASPAWLRCNCHPMRTLPASVSRWPMISITSAISAAGSIFASSLAPFSMCSASPAMICAALSS